MDWTIADDEVVMIDGDGSHRSVPASEIYSLYRQGEPSLPPLTYSRFPARISIRLSGSTSSTPRLSFIATLHGEEVEISNFLARKGDHVTNGSIWFPLEGGSVEDVRSLLAECQINHPADLSLWQYLKLNRLAKTYGVSMEDRWQGAANTTTAQGPSPESFKELNATLYPYQVDGAKWLAGIASEGLGCILGDEMGLGKTLQIIALMTAEKTKGRGPSLVVCPATLLENWRREIAKFTSNFTTLVHQGGGRTGSAATFLSADVVITSYDTCVRDYLLLQAVPWNCVVLDEAQAIKNPEAQRAMAVKSLPRRVAVAVTGTPVENRLEDLWSLVDFALPGMLGSREEFIFHFEDTVTDAQRLGPLVSPILLRRYVADVAEDLPPRIDVPQALTVPEPMAHEYEAIRTAAISEYGKGGSLASLIKLRLFTAHPALLFKSTQDLAEKSPKYQRLLELLDEIFCNGQKALVFSTFNKMTDLMLQDLPCRFPGIYVDFIDGRVTVASRQDKIDQFSATDAPGILILSPRAAGAGLNITVANHVIHYSPEWNPAIEDQASARAYRRGQTLPVTVHRLFYLNTIEDLMVDRLCHKRDLADGALTGNSGDTDGTDIIKALMLSPLGGK